MSGDSRRESHTPVVVERLSELILEIDSDLATVREFVNACMADEHSDLSRLEAFDAEFYVGQLYERMALAKGYFEQVGIGPDVDVLLREAENLRNDVHDYGEKLVRLADAAKQDAEIEADVLRVSGDLHDKAIVLNLDLLAVEETYGKVKKLFARLQAVSGLAGGLTAMVDESRERILNPNIDNAIAEADRSASRPGAVPGREGRKLSTISELSGNYAARFVCPPCPKCGGKAKVERTEGRVRRIKCQSAKCGHRWKVSQSD
jgi:hypothetical protein